MITINVKVSKAQMSYGTLVQKYCSFKNIYDKTNIEGFSYFNTDNIIIEYPSDIKIQNSYDGSVNLIITDNTNNPLLINSRFSALDLNKYRIISRFGKNNSNIYEKDTIVSSTSLYKTYSKFPNLECNLNYGGNLKVGRYAFYIKYSDQDGNETNIAAESKLVNVYQGDQLTKNGMHSNYSTDKSIELTIDNIDTSYNYINVYYSKYSSDKFSLTNTSIYKILDKYPILSSNSVKIRITGDENVEEITQNDLNTEYQTILQCKSISPTSGRLFLGNIKDYTINYTELSDLSLRIMPQVTIKGTASHDYGDLGGWLSVEGEDYGTGYWNEEIYRFGIVYIYNNNKLSPVFNILGVKDLDLEDYITTISQNTRFSIYQNSKIDDSLKIGIRQYLDINQEDFSIPNIRTMNKDFNSKGVVRLKYQQLQDTSNIYMQFIIPKQIFPILERLGITGYYFVRQKRIPTILTQIYTLDHATYIKCPVSPNRIVQGIPFKKGSAVSTNECTQSTIRNISNNSKCGICPDFTVRQPYFNQLFTGSTFPIKVLSSFNYSGTVYTYSASIQQLNYTQPLINAKLVCVKEDTPAVVVDNIKFSSRLGEAADALQFVFDYDSKANFEANRNTTDAVFRGIFSPYIGIISDQIPANSVLNVYISGYSESEIDKYFKIRYRDESPYYTISKRYSLNADEDGQWKISHTVGNGDCYNCSFTQRIHRNFQDPSAPNNSQLVSNKLYKDYYYDGEWKGADTINRGDINAIQIGWWLTMRVRSTNNLNIRSEDDGFPSEIALTGLRRSFYPYRAVNLDGNNKIPESQFINEGFSQSLGQRVNFLQAEVPYIKSDFQNRIMYSDIYISDAYQNGFRIFRQGNFVDYSSNYGGITRIMEYQGNLAIIFEHGIGISQIGQNESSVLSETPLIVSNQYGSLWHDSIVQTQDSIYGVDTDAKKIWRLRGQELTVISEFNIESYLQKNINLNQHDVIPSYDFKRVVTHYNAAKKDVIFTFYHRGESDFDELDENNKVIQWSLCWNEYLEKWQTFYSWMPFLSENINNIFFTLAYDNPYIWKHGNAGSYRYQDKLLPTFWYGKQHPFEFEFVVRADISTHKIFNNLEIISNNAEPESFHYEISPDCYDFAEDLNNMYFRQEHTKFFEREYNYRVLGKVKKIKYDEDVINNEELQTGIEQFVIEPKGELTQSGYYNKRSTLLPLKYYVRDTDENLIEDYYHETTSPSKDFKNLSGTEIISTSDGLKLQEHCIAADMRKVGRLRGNMYFKENKWFIQINPINFCQKNEHSTSWKLVENHWYPPIILQERLPKDWQVQGDILETNSPYLLKQAAIELDNWTNRQEIKLKDKYMKVKIRYTGDKLAIINSVITMYSEI